MSGSEINGWPSNGSDDGGLDAPDSANEFPDTDAFAKALSASRRPEVSPLDPMLLAKIDPLIAGDNRMVADAVVNMSKDPMVNAGWVGWITGLVKDQIGIWAQDFKTEIGGVISTLGTRIAGIESDLTKLKTTPAPVDNKEALLEVEALRRDNRELVNRVEKLEENIKIMTDLHKDAYAGMVEIYNEYRDSQKVTSSAERDKLKAEVDRLTAQLTSQGSRPTTGAVVSSQPTSALGVRFDHRPATTWSELRTRFRPSLSAPEAMRRFGAGER